MLLSVHQGQSCTAQCRPSACVGRAGGTTPCVLAPSSHTTITSSTLLSGLAGQQCGRPAGGHQALESSPAWRWRQVMGSQSRPHPTRPAAAGGVSPAAACAGAVVMVWAALHGAVRAVRCEALPVRPFFCLTVRVLWPILRLDSKRSRREVCYGPSGKRISTRRIPWPWLAERMHQRRRRASPA